jgi:hypothetical protein
MKNKTLVAVLAGCAGVLLICCIAGAAVILVSGNEVQKQISQALGQASELEGGAVVPSPLQPGGSGTPPVPGVMPTPGVQTRAAPAGGNPFADAIGKAKRATKYRIEFTWILGTTDQGKYQETPFLNMAGEVDGQNSHLTSKGGLLAMLAPDANATIEMIQVGGKTYMKGVTMFGMTDPKVWYITDDTAATTFKDFGKPDEFSSFTGGRDSDFRKVRSESLDGQSCDVWFYDFKSVQNAAIVGLLGSTKDKNEFGAIDKAEMSVWLCGDGLVHKWLLDYAGHDATKTSEKGALKITAHMWDYNSPSISVTPPKDAKPMPGK